MAQESQAEQVAVSVRNMGGIDTTEVSLKPGLTLFTGPNATNRTSLLRAIGDVLGGAEASLKTDAQEGAVEMVLGGSEGEETYACRYERSGGAVSGDRTPYSDESEYVDLFVSLLETNRARQAVERADGADLREVIMEPVDTDDIQRQIRSRNQERQDIVDRLEDIERARDELPTKEEQRNALREELNEIEDEIETVEAEIDQHQADVEEAEAAEALVDELDDLRDRELDIQDKIDSKERILETLRENRDEVEDELDGLSVDDDELESVEAELDQLQRREQSLTNQMGDLRGVIDFNEDLLEQDGSALPGTSDDEEAESKDPTAALDPMSETVECWTCGSQVERQVIHDRVDELRDRREQLGNERSDVEQRRVETQAEYKKLREAEKEQTTLERRLRERNSEIETAEEEIESLTEDLEDVRDEIEDLEDEIEETEELRESDLLETYRQLSDLEYERGQTQRELENATDEIERLDSLANEREQLEAQRAEVTDELSSLRTRIEDLERAAIESFNEEMETILDLLEYGNIERVWIERKSDSGSSSTSTSEFELHVIRATEDETVYEDTIATLSESEREVIGLVFALAGYLAHDVHEDIPFILLDSLEAIDAVRLARLVKHFSEQATYVVAALLPEDARELDEETDHSRPITRVSADVI